MLSETYGVIVYQEQVMKIASIVGGYSLGESDILRRAMGKKKADVMAEQKKMFVDRAIGLGYDKKKSDDLFELMAYFAGYGFNKSHSAAYALIAYQTAYLKANYPVEFATCLISLESGNAEKMSFYLKEARDMGIEILPPSINRSQIDFSVVDGKILFGLQGIKNIGLASLNNILAQRNKDGFFKDILNLCERIDLRASNKRVLENLICAGALDELAGSRAQKFNELANIIEMALQIKERKQTGQMQLFSISNSKENDAEHYVFTPCPDWSNKETLDKEKEVLGFYLSSHPLHTYAKELSWIQSHNISDLLALHQQKLHVEPTVIMFGLLVSKKIISTKKGDRMAFLQIEDLHNHAEIIIFPKLFKQIEPWLSDYTIFVVKGMLDIAAPNSCKIKAMQCVPFELLFHSWNKIVQCELYLPHEMSLSHIELLKEMEKGTIPLQVTYFEENKPMKLLSKKQISINFNMLNKLAQFDISGKITL